ncbi:DUF4112 domain-containing protein [Mariniblastus sp.]|nr:DUF4112 domain-containing protein [Mariniblastus sp.]
MNQIDPPPLQPSTIADPSGSKLEWVERWTDLLDTKFSIPGTNIRFGADFLLGLVPGVGDTISLGFSGLLIATMAKHGASSKLIARMLLNVLLDTTLGSIPILGNVFDLFYKANQRNFILMKEHYDEGKHSGSAWPLLIGIALVIMLAAGLMLWGAIAMVSWLWQMFAAPA